MAHRRLIYRDGIRIAYDVQGEGPLVLLIQGLAMSSQAWLLAPDQLMERGFRVAAIDNRGTGLSEVSLPPYSMRDMAADAARVLEHLGEPAIVAGLSLGGMVAQHLAIDHPYRVIGLVLAATTVGNPFGKLPKPKVLRTLTRGLLGHRPSMIAMRRYLVHPPNLDANPHLLRDFDRVVQAEGVRWQAVIGQLAAAGAHNTYSSVRRIRVPTEILTGDHDALVPPRNAHILARRIDDAVLTVLPNAGHAFPLERPDAIAQGVERVHARQYRARGAATNSPHHLPANSPHPGNKSPLSCVTVGS